MLDHLKAHLSGKIIILGIGNTLRSDDAAGSVLASRLQGKIPFTVYDTGANPENYLEKIVKERPDNLVIIDAADFGGKPGEFRVLEAEDLKTVNLFSTHNTSVELLTNYLQSQIKVDIIILIIQPKSIAFGDQLSPEVAGAINKLEDWFGESKENQG